MLLNKWKKISTEILSENPWWSYRADEYLLPDGKKGKYYYAHTFGSSFIVPVTPENKIIMVNQYRYLNDRFSIEFPGGGIKENQDPLFIARKELIEETGYDGELEKIGIFNPFNGVTNEICHVYTAKKIFKSSAYIKDAEEEFTILELTVDEVEEKFRTNEIYDGMSMAAWVLARPYLISK